MLAKPMMQCNRHPELPSGLKRTRADDFLDPLAEFVFCQGSQLYSGRQRSLKGRQVVCPVYGSSQGCLFVGEATLRFEQPLLEGTLIRRKRFIADVKLRSGEEITAHCANPGSMLGCSEPG